MFLGPPTPCAGRTLRPASCLSRPDRIQRRSRCAPRDGMADPGAPILRYVAADPIQPPDDPGRSPDAIRDMLAAGDRAEFARCYAGALEEARRDWSLQPVDDILEQWRRIAMRSRSPGPPGSPGARSAFPGWR